MRVWTLAVIAAAALIMGCEQVSTDGDVPVTGAPANDNTATTPPAADNTAVNQRDADRDATKTPIDQNENKADVERTAEIRKQILATPDMSTYAQNVKVITADGKVTLRGPVKDEAERDLIVKIATGVAGEGNVDNKLELAPANP